MDTPLGDVSLIEIIEQVEGVITTYGLSVIGALIILILGWIASGIASRWVERLLGRIRKFDVTLRKFFASLVKYLVLIFTGLAVLHQFGIQTASLLAVFGAASLAVGLALQGTLSHLASGIMLLIFRPFKVGDYIDAGSVKGTVQAVNLFMTELTSPDNVQILAPNGELWGAAVQNYSYHTTRRLDFVFGIGYDDDIDKALSVLNSLLESDDRCQRDPAPTVVVGGLGDSSVDLIVRVWCKASDYWALKWDLTKQVKQQFDAENISFPYPHRTVELVKTEEA